MEEYLIDYCSATLAGLKPGSLFNYPFVCREELADQLETWNQALGEKGISLQVLRQGTRTALIYMCRRTQLCQTLSQPPVTAFLYRLGYVQTDVDEMLLRLKGRMKRQTFPHEIGVFLGYPLGDVMGFMKNEGKNCKCTGCWKVYGDEIQARACFARLDGCRNAYRRLWRQGKSVWQLTVAA